MLLLLLCIALYRHFSTEKWESAGRACAWTPLHLQGMGGIARGGQHHPSVSRKQKEAPAPRDVTGAKSGSPLPSPHPTHSEQALGLKHHRRGPRWGKSPTTFGLWSACSRWVHWDMDHRIMECFGWEGP